MTDFRLLRHGGFYHALARYGPDIWTPFTYAGLHATERVLQRKEQHRFWGVDCSPTGRTATCERAANMSRVVPGIIKSRHGPYLERWYREHEQRHNDGVNRLVVQFAREGVEVVAGWRGELNVPGLTQVRPDLLVPAREGPKPESTEGDGRTA